MIFVFGISNCDTIRKTGKWLDSQGLQWNLHDYRKNGLDADLLQQLFNAFEMEELINRRGSSWRELDAESQAALDSPGTAVEVLQATPALIKRPIVRTSDGEWLSGYESVVQKIGFKASEGQLNE